MAMINCYGRKTYSRVQLMEGKKELLDRTKAKDTFCPALYLCLSYFHLTF